ncbi:MAG: D-Ala-D-Ala carboxypeptidase family metallohydrolase [Oscillospiraceae bacterium]|nr:D-Ala-D-Ala carboxypeptidase family metallohydrolase [Oscillospiraceae bacterium]
MPAKEYSLKKDGNTYLSKNFQVKEFRCRDGNDKILIDDALVQKLQAMRDCFGVPVNINSAYRTAAYNKKVGGASNSRHLCGTAADIAVKGVNPLTICRFSQGRFNGIGLYDTFSHVDARPDKSYWKQNKETGQKQVSVSGFGDFKPSAPGKPIVPAEPSPEFARKLLRIAAKLDDPGILTPEETEFFGIKDGAEITADMARDVLRKTAGLSN